jgi:NADH dehydrogenase
MNPEIQIVATAEELNRVATAGFPAWTIWALIHIFFLLSFGNRLRVWTQLMWSYLIGQRSSQLILEPRAEGAQ